LSEWGEWVGQGLEFENMYGMGWDGVGWWCVAEKENQENVEEMMG